MVIRVEDRSGGTMFEEPEVSAALRNDSRLLLWAARTAVLPLESPHFFDPYGGQRPVIAEILERVILMETSEWVRQNSPTRGEECWLCRHVNELEGNLADPAADWKRDVLSPFMREYPAFRPQFMWHLLGHSILSREHSAVSNRLRARWEYYCRERTCPQSWDYQIHLRISRERVCKQFSYESVIAGHYGHLVVVDYDEENVDGRKRHGAVV